LPPSVYPLLLLTIAAVVDVLFAVQVDSTPKVQTKFVPLESDIALGQKKIAFA
jgi:hypothetical protein